MKSAESIPKCLNLRDETGDIPTDLLHHQPVIQPDPLLITQLIIQRMHLQPTLTPTDTPTDSPM